MSKKGNKGFFITGTDTGVGKTFVAGLIINALKEKGIDVAVMKPVETGCAEKKGILMPNDALFLQKTAGVTDDLNLVNPYRFKEPIAPSAAARFERKTIKLSKIKNCYQRLASKHDFIIVESAGGLLVPLNRKETILDLIKLLKLPVIIIASINLGAINHTLLTVKYAKEAGIKVKGIIFNHPEENKKGSAKLDVIKEVKRFTDVPIIGDVHFSEKKLPEQVISRILYL